METMKKVAFHLNCLTHGGAERVVSNLANKFAAEGYETIVATEWTDEDEFPLDPRVRRIHVGLRPEDESKSRVQKFLLRKKYLHEFMLSEKPDVLAAFAKRALYRALMAQPGTGVPVVISVRIDPVKYYSSLTDRFQTAVFMKRAAGAVFQTADARKFFAKQFPENYRIIMNPVSDKYIGLPPVNIRSRHIVNVARIVDFKNQPMLVEAFAAVHAKHPDYDLQIYGPDGEDGTRQRILDKIAEEGLEDCVHLMGGSDSLEKQIHDAACFAYSSDYEGLPNSLLEAMTMGLPCVSTDCPCGGPRELIDNGVNGILVPVGDAAALADGICYVLEHPGEAMQMGKKAAKISQRASIQNVFIQWRNYLEEVANRV